MEQPFLLKVFFSLRGSHCQDYDQGEMQTLQSSKGNLVPLPASICPVMTHIPAAWHLHLSFVHLLPPHALDTGITKLPACKSCWWNFCITPSAATSMEPNNSLCAASLGNRQQVIPAGQRETPTLCSTSSPLFPFSHMQEELYAIHSDLNNT